MLQSIPPSTDSSQLIRENLFSKTFHVSGKVFLLGEYAILAELPALVAAVGPRFQLKAERLAERPLWSEIHSDREFHPKSPVSQLIQWSGHLGAPDLHFDFQDPWKGAGGFGASTAQFALVYATYARLLGWTMDWEKVWKLYRELTAVQSGISPSGADLVAQWQGGVNLFGPREDGVGYFCETLSGASGLADFPILVFSATSCEGRKVATHDHLKQFKQKDVLETLGQSLFPSLKDGIAAVRGHDPAALGAAMDRYAEVLFEYGLEISSTTEDRRVLRQLPGVLGVKGAGALQADGVLVVLDREHWQESLASGGVSNSTHRSLKAQVIEQARERGLVLVSEGCGAQKGIQCES